MLFISGLTHGVAGFGFGLISVPILLIFLPPSTVMPMIMLYSVINALIVLLTALKYVDLRRIWILMVTAIIGMPLGVYILKVIEPELLKTIVGVVIAIFAIALMKGYQHHFHREKLASIPIGFISGILNGSITLSGPPVILFFTNQGVPKDTFRANMVAYFLVLNTLTVPAYFFTGLITPAIVHSTLILLPAVLIGVISGIILTKRINESVFKKIALSIVLLAGVSLAMAVITN